MLRRTFSSAATKDPSPTRGGAMSITKERASVNMVVLKSGRLLMKNKPVFLQLINHPIYGTILNWNDGEKATVKVAGSLKVHECSMKIFAINNALHCFALVTGSEKKKTFGFQCPSKGDRDKWVSRLRKQGARDVVDIVIHSGRLLVNGKHRWVQLVNTSASGLVIQHFDKEDVTSTLCGSYSVTNCSVRPFSVRKEQDGSKAGGDGKPGGDQEEINLNDASSIITSLYTTHFFLLNVSSGKKLLQFGSSIKDDIIKWLRRLEAHGCNRPLLQGYLFHKKPKSRSWKNRYFVLWQYLESLEYYKEPGNNKPLGQISLTTAIIHDIDENGFIFLIKNKENGENHEFMTEDNVQVKERWLSLMKTIGTVDADDDEKEDVQTWQSDKNCSICLLCDEKFMTTRPKHHCRRCGHIICNDCSQEKRILNCYFEKGKKEPIYNESGKMLRVCDACVEVVEEEEQKKYQHRKAEWLPTKSFKECPICFKKFGLTRKKHHCRGCGYVVCDACSKERRVLSSYCDGGRLTIVNKDGDAVRICDNCVVAVDMSRRPTEAPRTMSSIVDDYTGYPKNPEEEVSAASLLSAANLSTPPTTTDTTTTTTTTTIHHHHHHHHHHHGDDDNTAHS